APEPSRLLLEAEVAMYAAKSSGRGWEFYAPEHDHHSRERLTLVAELRRAIDGDELEVHYQPKVDLRSGAVFGMEALVRWRHPERGLLGPDVFVPVAEEAGLIRSLTLRVLDAAAQEHRALTDLGFGHLEVAVNLSLRSMVELDFPDQVAKVLRRHGVPPTALTLEITESSVLSDPARTVGMLVRLAELGTTISVDDFGTGYASLSHLKRLPAGELKIDRSFVAGMLDAPRDAAIVASTIDLARKLGLRAVAEGVEDGDTWAALAELGCDQVQGYFVSRPLPPPQLEAWLVAKRSGPSTPHPRPPAGVRPAALRGLPR
ncbi:EAL domain-containing protein, partial [Acidimicrobiaceae bacterium USS-CC1]|nr:EAL domain-containing protein [Acidiferrimicrobium australe]